MLRKSIYLIAVFFLLQTGIAIADYDTLWTKYTQRINRLQFSNDDSKILTCGDAGILIFDTETGDLFKKLIGKGYYSEDKTKIVALREINVDIYDANTYELIKTIELPFHGTYFVELLAGSNKIVAVGKEFVSFIDYNTGEVLKRIDNNKLNEDEYLETIAYTTTKNGKYVIISMTKWDSHEKKYVNSTMIFINSETYAIDYELKKKASMLRTSDDGSLLAFTTNEEDIAVSIMNTETKQIVRSIPGYAPMTMAICFSPDGKEIAVSINDKENGIKVYDIITLKQIEHLTLQHTNGKYYFFNTIDYLSDNKKIACASGQRLVLFDNTTNVFEDNEGKIYTIYPNPSNNTVQINFDLKVPTKITLAITNSLGQNVSTIPRGFFESGEQTIDYDCSNLSNGIYFLTLTGENFKVTYKLVKEG